LQKIANFVNPQASTGMWNLHYKEVQKKCEFGNDLTKIAKLAKNRKFCQFCKIRKLVLAGGLA